MPFKFESVSVEQVREQYATSKDTMLSQVARSIVAAMEGVEATPLLTLDDLEMQDSAFQDWQIRQRERRSNPQDEKDSKAQVITVDAIARKINAEVDTTGVRALRRNGGLIFVQNSDWNPEDDEVDA
jgi:hypothetical protein